MAIRREPILWLTTDDSTNGATERQRSVLSPDGGETFLEKFPQHGHEGDYENKSKARGVRYIKVVRHEGHTIPMCLTNAAAHLDAAGPYANYMRAKGRFLGWYPEGACPAALFAAGELSDKQVASPDVRKAKPCKPGTHSQKSPCEHDLAERAARTARWNAKHAKRMAGYQTDADRYMATLQKANAELVANVAEVVANKMADAVRPPPEARQPSK